MAYMSLEEYHDLSGGEKRAPQSPKRQDIEYQEQVKLFKVLRNPLIEARHPELKLIFSTLNGIQAGKAQTGKAKAAGALKGTPDIICLIPRSTIHGLCIEMKAPAGKQTIEQQDFEAMVEGVGYEYAVCRSASEALETIENYLGYKLGD